MGFFRWNNKHFQSPSLLCELLNYGLETADA